MYEEVDRREKITDLKGTYAEKEGKIVADVHGNYKEYDKGKKVETINVDRKNVSGTFVMEKIGNKIRISQTQLKDGGFGFQGFFEGA